MNKRHNTVSLIQVILILSSFLLLNCGGESVVQEMQVEKQEGFQSYRLDINGKAIPFADLIDKIEITRLEETEESLLSSISEIQFSGDKMVFPSGRESSIYVYSKTGKFLNRINRKGEGPEEYTGHNDIWLEGDTLALYNYNRSINRYDLEGNFISREPMREQAAHVYPFGDGYALDMNYNATKDTMRYLLLTLDNELEIDKTFFPFEKYPGFAVSMSINSFFELDNEMLFLRMLSDTVYQLGLDKVEPIIHYDFGDDWYFQPNVEMDDKVFTESGKNRSVWFMHNRIGKRYIFLRAAIGMDQSEYFLIDKQNMSSIRIDRSTSLPDEFVISSIGWDGDKMILTLQSTQVSELLDQLNQDQYSFTEGTTLEEIESSENPALIRIALKD